MPAVTVPSPVTAQRVDYHNRGQGQQHAQARAGQPQTQATLPRGGEAVLSQASLDFRPSTPFLAQLISQGGIVLPADSGGDAALHGTELFDRIARVKYMPSGASLPQPRSAGTEAEKAARAPSGSAQMVDMQGIQSKTAQRILVAPGFAQGSAGGGEVAMAAAPAEIRVRKEASLPPVTVQPAVEDSGGSEMPEAPEIAMDAYTAGVFSAYQATASRNSFNLELPVPEVQEVL